MPKKRTGTKKTRKQSAINKSAKKRNRRRMQSIPKRARGGY